MKIRSFLLFLFIFMSWHITTARAAVALTEKDLLSFGEIIVATHSVESVIIMPDGSQTNEPGLPKLLPGRNGVYLFSGFLPAIPVSISVADTVLIGPGAATFDIHDFTFDPAGPAQITDGSGNMTLNIGATLSTRVGGSYGDGPYRGTYTLMVNY